MKTIALLTDFGYGEYVGIMKGVIVTHCKQPVNIIDITHSIEPQNILQASWILSTAVPYFPEGTVFVCVVDPGVGGERNAILIETNKCFLIGPNNGIFTHTLKMCDLEILHIYELNTKQSSNTFQGRDVFSKNAGLLCHSNSLEMIDGKRNDDIIIEYLSLYSNHVKCCTHLTNESNSNRNEKEIIVQIVSIDSFGNLISDYFVSNQNEIEQMKRIQSIQFVSSDESIPIHFCKTYEEGSKHSYPLICLIGSNNTFEISVVNGNAQKHLHCSIGSLIKLQF